MIFATLGFVVFATLSVHAAPGVPPLGAFLAALAGITSAAAAQISGLPGPLPLPPPTIYSAPTPRAVGATDQSGSGGRAAGRALAVADGTRTDIPDVRAREPVLSTAANAGPD